MDSEGRAGNGVEGRMLTKADGHANDGIEWYFHGRLHSEPMLVQDHAEGTGNDDHGGKADEDRSFCGGHRVALTPDTP